MTKHKKDPETVHAEEIVTDTITEMEPEKAKTPTVPVNDISQLRRVYGDGFGTSGYAIRNAAPIMQDDGFLRQETWLRQVKATEIDTSETGVDELLEQGITQIRLAVTDLASFESLTNRDLAGRAIRLGIMLLALKKLARQKKLKWGAWATERIPFLGERNRQRYMQVAGREDAHAYAFLGIDRLYLLCVATESQVGKVEDPIGDFLRRHQIHFDPTSDFDLDEFKRSIDAAMQMDFLVSHGVEGADPELVRNLTLANVKVDKALATELKTLQQYGANPNDRLRDLTMTRGRIREPEEKIKTMDFNKLSINLIKTADVLLKDSEKLETVNAQLVLDLFKRLEILRRLLPVEASKEAAA